MDEYRKEAEDIIRLLGGSENITEIENCMTRIRVDLVDEDLVDVDGLKGLKPTVMGVVPDKTTQVIVGPGKVDKVCGQMEKILGEDKVFAASAGAGSHAGAPGAGAAASAPAGPGMTSEAAAIKAAQKKKNNTPFKNFLRRIANIFVPLIPALIGCGVIAGINGVLTNLGNSGIAPGLLSITPALDAIARGFLSLITVFVGMNAAKEFGGTPVVGGAVAAIIPFAGIEKVQVFGEALVPGRGGVLGALAAAVLAAYLERWARKWAPDSLSMLIVPTVAILGAGLATIFVLMTVFGQVADAIGVFANWLLGVGGFAAGLILAGLFLPLVMLGLHQALIPIHTTLIENDGYTVLLPILSMAGAGQVGAAAAIFLKLRNNSAMRSTIKSALPAGILGVGEPLIYGVTLPLGRPFMTACAGGAVGGAFIGLMYQLGTSVGSTAIGPSGWALFPLVNGSKGILPAVIVYGVGLLIGYVAGFVATYFFGFSKDTLAEANEYEEASERDHGQLVDHAAAGAVAGGSTTAKF